MKTNPNDPIDWSQYVKSMTDIHGVTYEGANPGLTKREYFAALALQGFLSGKMVEVLPYDMTVKHAVVFADYLIVELNKQKDQT